MRDARCAGKKRRQPERSVAQSKDLSGGTRPAFVSCPSEGRNSVGTEIRRSFDCARGLAPRRLTALFPRASRISISRFPHPAALPNASASRRMLTSDRKFSSTQARPLTPSRRPQFLIPGQPLDRVRQRPRVRRINDQPRLPVDHGLARATRRAGNYRQSVCERLGNHVRQPVAVPLRIDDPRVPEHVRPSVSRLSFLRGSVLRLARFCRPDPPRQ